MLQLDQIEFKDACEFVKIHHRHHKPPRGHRFSLCVTDDTCQNVYGNKNLKNVVGVVIVGRPVARGVNKKITCEVLRVATDGTKHVCSKLYNGAVRAALALKYKKVITYILCSETGISLIAAGWKCLGEAGGGSWDTPSRRRTDKAPIEKKIKFEAA